MFPSQVVMGKSLLCDLSYSCRIETVLTLRIWIVLQHGLLKYVFELFFSRTFVIDIFVSHRPHAAGLFVLLGCENDSSTSRTSRRIRWKNVFFARYPAFPEGSPNTSAI